MKSSHPACMNCPRRVSRVLPPAPMKPLIAMFFLTMSSLVVGCGAPQATVDSSIKGSAFDVSVRAYASNLEDGTRVVDDALQRARPYLDTDTPMPGADAFIKSQATRASFVADRIREELFEGGLSRVHIEAGQVIVLGDGPPRTKGWRVSLRAGPTWKKVRRIALVASRPGLWNVTTPAEYTAAGKNDVPDGAIAMMAPTARSAAYIFPMAHALSTIEPTKWKELLAQTPGAQAWVYKNGAWTKF